MGHPDYLKIYQHMRAWLSSLTGIQVCIVGHYFGLSEDGLSLSITEIADMLDIPRHACQTQLKIAIKKINDPTIISELWNHYSAPVDAQEEI